MPRTCTVSFGVFFGLAVLCATLCEDIMIPEHCLEEEGKY